MGALSTRRFWTMAPRVSASTSRLAVADPRDPVRHPCLAHQLDHPAGQAAASVFRRDPAHVGAEGSGRLEVALGGGRAGRAEDARRVDDDRDPVGNHRLVLRIAGAPVVAHSAPRRRTTSREAGARRRCRTRFRRASPPRRAPRAPRDPRRPSRRARSTARRAARLPCSRRRSRGFGPGSSGAPTACPAAAARCRAAP